MGGALETACLTAGGQQSGAGVDAIALRATKSRWIEVEKIQV
jgi:hypothetical protein